MNKQWAWAAVPIVLAGYFVWRVATSPVLSEEGRRRQELAACVQHTGVGMHIHPQLTVTMKGEKMEVPANTGIEGGCMHPIHTHDNSGRLHLEFKKPHEVKLGEFFEIWGKPLEKEGLTMKVNGQDSTEFDNYVMHDHDEIELSYE